MELHWSELSNYNGQDVEPGWRAAAQWLWGQATILVTPRRHLHALASALTNELAEITPDGMSLVTDLLVHPRHLHGLGPVDVSGEA